MFLSSNVIVQVDSRYAAKDIAFDDSYIKILVNAGSTELLCVYSVHEYLVSPETPPPEWSLEYIHRNYLLEAKLSALANICLDVALDNLKICFQKDISFKSEKNILKRYYKPELTEIYADGAVRQYYGDATTTDAIINFSCSQDIVKLKPLQKNNGLYNIYVTAPYFCNWQKNSDYQNKIYSLLYDLENVCFDYRDEGARHFVYCHPYVAILRPQTGSKSTNTILGKLSDKSDKNYWSQQSQQAFNSFKPKTANSIKWKHIFYEKTEKIPPDILIEIYQQSRTNVLSEPLKMLILKLQPGSECAVKLGKPIPYTTNIFFYCPASFEANSSEKFIKAAETSFCHFDFFVQTPALCAHPEFLPSMYQHNYTNTVLCYGLEKELSHASKKLLSKITDVVKNNLDMDAKFKVAEHIPLDSLISQPSENSLLASIPIDHFANVSYIRRREGSLNRDPLYHVGDTVQHKILNVVGVVCGWDQEVRATETWLNNLKHFYPLDMIINKPFYRIRLLDNDGSLTETQIYSSEATLTKLELQTIMNFTPFVYKLYPDDFNLEKSKGSTSVLM